MYTYTVDTPLLRSSVNVAVMPSILPLTSNFTLPFLLNSHLPSIPFKSLSKSHLCFSFSPPNQNRNGPQEEARWLREEQRWLREEQRWLREEGRWSEERRRLVQEISSLKLRVEELEQLNSLPAASFSDTVANFAKLLQVLKDGDLGKTVNRITESGSSAVPLVVEKDEKVVIKDVISVSDGNEIVKRRLTLRNGAEGEEVQAMQEALQKLGFYSGEEDIEFSSFSSGTEHAVKTWQSSIGAREDGIMTAELLKQLFMEQNFGSSGPGVTKNKENKSDGPKKNKNGAPISSTSKVQKTREGGPSEVSEFPHRVFLLGENRWEDPSRLSGSSKRTVPINTSTSNATIVKCLACHGEGHVLCMECDGTGEPNIEPQFLEWVDEGTKCPYCEGLGFAMCDVCGGETTGAL